MKLGNLLQKLRHNKKLSQNEVADQVGVCQSTYFAWENDRSMPNARYYAKLAAAFGIDPKELIPDDLTVLIASPIDVATEPTVLNARLLYEDLLASQKQTIRLQQQRIEHLEADNQRLQELLNRVGRDTTRSFLFIISPINFIGNLIETIVFPIGVC